MKRPKVKDVWDAVLKETAEEIVKSGASRLTDVDDVFNDLKKEVNSYNDGYQIAKKLDDNCMWEIDPEIVEILDNLPTYAHLRKATEEWMQKYGVVLTKKIDDTVTVTERGMSVAGQITGLYRETAEYVVTCESLGHVREGEGTTGFIIKGEDVDGLKITQTELELV